ncbi:MAG: hypothetical protein ACR2GZ_06015 [Solirubrobacteraceae bacterium]
MSQRTLEAQPRANAPAQAGSPTEPPAPWTLRLFARSHPAWTTTIGLIVLSAVIVFWADTRPGFDPYGWLVWGHQTTTLSLDTNAAPSWKPLPWVFTVPSALAGHYQLRLWMITSVAISLSAVVFAARIAYRLTDAPAERRWAGLVAGAFAGIAVLGIQNYAHYVLSAQSDPMIVSLCLGAIDCHLSGRPRTAFLLGTLASLGRPEVWPFLGLYSIWAWRTVPRSRVLLVAGWAAIVGFWFGIPAITSRSPFVAANNAMGSGRRLTSGQIVGTIKRFLAINELPVELAALLAVALAAWRRDRVVLVLTAAIVTWVVIEVAFALHGWPGLVRYMFEAGGLVVVLSGVAVGWLLSGPSKWPTLPAPGLTSASSWVGPALAVILVASLIPAGISHASAEHKDLHEQRARTAEINALTPVIDRLGGAARLNACGEPLTRLQYQTMLAYTLRINVNKVGFKYGQAMAHGNPIILFTPYASKTGWVVKAMHQTNPSCRALPR